MSDLGLKHKDIAFITAFVHMNLPTQERHRLMLTVCHVHVYDESVFPRVNILMYMYTYRSYDPNCSL